MAAPESLLRRSVPVALSQAPRTDAPAPPASESVSKPRKYPFAKRTMTVLGVLAGKETALSTSNTGVVVGLGPLESITAPVVVAAPPPPTWRGIRWEALGGHGDDAIARIMHADSWTSRTRSVSIVSAHGAPSQTASDNGVARECRWWDGSPTFYSPK